MKKRAILYARVSTNEQADKGYSLPSQLANLRKYAERNDFEIVGEHLEDFSGAVPLEARPEGKKAFAMLTENKADVLIVYRMDRLVRPPEDGDEFDVADLVRGLAKLGKEIHICNRGKIEPTLLGLLAALLEARVAGEERRAIQERTMRGKVNKVNSGRVVASRAPYGFKKVLDEHHKVRGFEIVEETAKVVRLIYKWYVDGYRGKLLSQEAIVARLNSMGISPPGKWQRGYEALGPLVKWNSAAVHNILTSEIYAGVFRFAEYVGKTRHRRPDDEAKTTPVEVPAIIDRATWDRAQERKRANLEQARRNAKYDYLLSGILKCGCGKKMHGVNSRGKYFSYACDGRTKKPKTECKQRSIKRDLLEERVWEGLKTRAKDTSALEHNLRAAQQLEFSSQDPKREELDLVETSIAETEARAAKLARTLSAVDPDGVSGRAIKKDIDTNDALYREQTKRRDELKDELASQTFTDAAIDDILIFAEDVATGLDNATFEEKRRDLETLNVQVKVSDGHFHLTSLLGDWDYDLNQRRSVVPIAIGPCSGT